jgi:hypothetical protein
MSGRTKRQCNGVLIRSLIAISVSYAWHKMMLRTSPDFVHVQMRQSRRSPKVRPLYHFKNKDTEYVSESCIKRMNGSTKRQWTSPTLAAPVEGLPGVEHAVVVDADRLAALELNAPGRGPWGHSGAA